MIISKCLVCETEYDKKEEYLPGIHYSHGYCSSKCRLVSKRITKESENKAKTSISK
jgi:uncharacterized C2H2 Zn-finger protein